ncbi:MAG: hypothetical protein DMG85_10460 [Acidobacteria bacterium]|nr:MAG: hypothetical protein DMG85_10460 [Acidobacteriota bacterium]
MNPESPGNLRSFKDLRLVPGAGVKGRSPADFEITGRFRTVLKIFDSILFFNGLQAERLD